MVFYDIEYIENVDLLDADSKKAHKKLTLEAKMFLSCDEITRQLLLLMGNTKTVDVEMYTCSLTPLQSMKMYDQEPSIDPLHVYFVNDMLCVLSRSLKEKIWSASKFIAASHYKDKEKYSARYKLRQLKWWMVNIKIVISPCVSQSFPIYVHLSSNTVIEIEVSPQDTIQMILDQISSNSRLYVKQLCDSIFTYHNTILQIDSTIQSNCINIYSSISQCSRHDTIDLIIKCFDGNTLNITVLKSSRIKDLKLLICVEIYDYDSNNFELTSVDPYEPCFDVDDTMEQCNITRERNVVFIVPHAFLGKVMSVCTSVYICMRRGGYCKFISISRACIIFLFAFGV